MCVYTGNIQKWSVPTTDSNGQVDGAINDDGARPVRYLQFPCGCERCERLESTLLPHTSGSCSLCWVASSVPSLCSCKNK